jgi:DNA polymerase-4
MNKPDGLTFLPQETLPESLFSLSLTDITGIGVNMEKRLNRLGIASLRVLVQLSPKHIRKAWGSVLGERLWYLLQGYELEPAATNTSIIGHSRVLDPQTRTPNGAKKNPSGSCYEGRS